MAKNTHPIEQLDRYFVDDARIFGRIGAARQQTLGCVAHHFNLARSSGENPLIHASKVAECTRQEYVTVRGVLSRLATHGALATIEEEATGQRRGTRRYYTPNPDTEIGARTLKLMSDSLAVCPPQVEVPQIEAPIIEVPVAESIPDMSHVPRTLILHDFEPVGRLVVLAERHRPNEIGC